MENDKKRIRLLSYETAYGIIAIIMSSAMTAVFFGMAMQAGGLYASDTPPHIDEGLLLHGYGLEAIFIYLVGKVAVYPMIQLIVAVYETVLVMATWVLSQKLINEFFDLDRRIVLAISTGLIFLSAIYIPNIISDFYIQGLGTQPWHNSTYFGMRFVGLIYIIYLFRSLPHYLKGISFSEWWKMAVSLALSTMCKPNFLLSVCVAFGILFIVDFLKLRTLEGFKNIIIMGTTVIPSVVVLAIQYILMFVSGNNSDSGIEVVWFSDLMWFGTWKHMIVKLFRPFMFLFIVLLLEFRMRNTKININMLFVITLYISSLAIFSIFKETGIREYDANFSWAVPMGYYVMYLYIVPSFVRRFLEWRKGRVNKRLGVESVCYITGFVLLILHCISGICYFEIIASGRNFLC